MKKYKICVYAICKNEESFVDRWMDAVSEADMVIVTDTGSTDNTVEKLRSRGATVYVENIKPWRFDTARNIAMDHIPEDVDICVSNDMDEVFEKGWRKKLEDSWADDATQARYIFTWSYNEDGTPNKQFGMEKIHLRHGFRWIHPVHEVLQYTGEKLPKKVGVNMVLNHYPDKSKPRSQYLPLLEMSVKEFPEDDRGRFWLGREYIYYSKYDECIKTLEEYLKIHPNAWVEERSAAMRFISNSYKEKNNMIESKNWLFKSIAECPYVREPYFYMARLGYELNDWLLVYFMVTKALEIKKTTGSYLMEVAAWNFSLYDLGAISSYYLGFYDKSYEFAIKAIEKNPKSDRLKSNLELIKKKLQ